MYLDERQGFCVMPWSQIVLDTKGHFKLCGLSGESPQQGDLKEYWYSNYLQGVRSNMLSGKWNSECRACQKNEANNLPSKRHFLNSATDLEKMDCSLTPSLPKFVELRFGNFCNYNCRMCNPGNSSSISEEYQNIEWGSGFSKSFRYQESVTYSYDQVKNKIPALVEIKVLKLSGGEPLVMAEAKALCEELIDLGLSKNIELLIVTSLGALSDDWLAILKKFKTTTLQVSMDATGKLFEYIRHGIEWGQVDTNIKRLMGSDCSIRVKVSPCVQAYNLLGLKDLYLYVKDIKFQHEDRVILINPFLLEGPKLFIHNEFT